MKLRPVKRDADTIYPSFDDYVRHRPALLRKLMVGAGVLVAGGASALMAEPPGPVPGTPPAVKPKQVEVRPPGELVAPDPSKAAKPLTEKQKAEAEALIAQLGDESFKKREAAQKTLAEMGRGVVVVLEKHADHKDAEIRSRVKALIETFEPRLKPVRAIHRIEGKLKAPEPVRPVKE